jgi:hypothetical protein
MADRTSDSSTASTHRAEFAQRVNDRDGGACLMTGVRGSTQACHIVPHAKGNQVCFEYLNHSHFSSQAQYVNDLASHRNEVLDPPLDHIDDPRNGILLATHLHRAFGDSEIAFLQVSCSIVFHVVELICRPPISQCLSTTCPSFCNPIPSI